MLGYGLSRILEQPRDLGGFLGFLGGLVDGFSCRDRFFGCFFGEVFGRCRLCGFGFDGGSVCGVGFDGGSVCGVLGLCVSVDG